MTRDPTSTSPISTTDTRLQAALEVLAALIARQVAADHRQVAHTEDLTDDEAPQS